MSKRCWFGPVSSYAVFSRSNISATIHPINIVPRSFWTSFVSSFQWLHLIRDVKYKFFQEFLLQWNAFVWGSHIGVRTKAENFRNAPKLNFDLYVISFICTNFEAFTTFSAIFTRIRCTSNLLVLRTKIYDFKLVYFFGKPGILNHWTHWLPQLKFKHAINFVFKCSLSLSFKHVINFVSKC